ncbi:hypothetical protein [Brockia lithotrophica]|uniref:Uncharacterized protein n=1 Tax=Brockia lithotrophica TaxID=933949 RepID=A0A660L7Q9_9BACL|nr:hypothetical protein [Brockia lithotrophica]RKQ88889.1 hypothetical protein C7438_0541 [Brockia lithotrophica]
MKNSFLTVSLVLALAFFFGFVLGLSFGELVRDRPAAGSGGERSTASNQAASSGPHAVSEVRTSPTDDAARRDAHTGPETSEETREVSHSAPSDPLGVEEGFLASLGKFLGNRLEAGTRNAVRFLPGSDP